MGMTDVRVLFHLLRGQRRHGTLAQRLQAFYGPQAEMYDNFRERLLHGRKELIERLDIAPGGTLVDLGGGTGRTLLYLGDRIESLARVDLVDLCPALLGQAAKRNLRNVRLVDSDASSYQPDGPVDTVLFSYSLTMMPNWRAAIDNGISMLKPGGRLGVVDFFVSDAQPHQGVRHGALTRAFWPRWFGHDGVHPSPEHLRYLRARFPDHDCLQHSGSVPYLPGLKVPYYVFVGRRPAMAGEG